MTVTRRIAAFRFGNRRFPRQLTAGASIVRITAWTALLIGVLATVNEFDSPLVVAAGLCGATFVVGASMLNLAKLEPSGITFQVISSMGAVLTAAAVTLTGGLGSPYLLLAITPALFAAIVGGYRTGLVTGLVSAALISSVAATGSGLESLVSSAGTIALFPLMALVVAQIRSLLVEAEARADSLERATEAAEAELATLGQANQLLRRLTDVYGEGTTNPVEVGRRVIEAIVESQPGSFATATLFDAQGPVVVARAGTDAPALVRNQFSLGDGDTTSGVVSLATPDPMTYEARAEVEHLLRPVGVSFANAVLLQQIAGEAVREERLRLARELHDEVGPALAALGLELDGLALQSLAPDGTTDLDRVREGLGAVVEDLRGIIADLRADESMSLARAIAATVAPLEPPPTVQVEIHERRPPVGPAGRHIVAVVTEAVRNAYRHAAASSIRVSGSVDVRAVEIEVTDDGRGFDPNVLPDGHYGVMGMRERADRIGAQLGLHSNTSGTTVRIAWKEDR